MLQAEAGALAALQRAGYADAAQANAASSSITPQSQCASASLQCRRAGAAGRVARRAERRVPAELHRRACAIGRSATLTRPSVGALAPRHRRHRRGVARDTRLGRPTRNGVRDVVLEIEPAARNAYELGFGYSTTEGLGLEAEWTRRNFSGRADALTLSTTLGEMRSNR